MTALTVSTPAVTAWSEAITAFDQHLRTTGRRCRTRQNYRHHLHDLARQHPADPWALTPAAIAAWLDTRGASARTAYAVARLFYGWARLVGHTHADPTPARPPRRTSPPSTVPLTPAWDDALGRHLTSLRAAGRTPRTQDVHASYLNRLALAFPDRQPYDLTSDDLANWLAGMSWKPETRRSAMNCLRLFFGRAVRSGQLDRSPVDDLDPVRVPRGVPRPAPTDVLRSALATADDHTRLMVLLAALAGLRAVEIARVHPARDLVDGILYVKGKGGHGRRVPVHPILATEIEAERTRRRLGMPGTGLRNAIAANCSPDGYLFPSASPAGHMTSGNVVVRVAKVLPDSWTCHTLRHRFATQAYAAERDLRAVQELLGHASPATTARYTQVPTDALSRAVLNAEL